MKTIPVLKFPITLPVSPQPWRKLSEPGCFACCWSQLIPNLGFRNHVLKRLNILLRVLKPLCVVRLVPNTTHQFSIDGVVLNTSDQSIPIFMPSVLFAQCWLPLTIRDAVSQAFVVAYRSAKLKLRLRFCTDKHTPGTRYPCICTAQNGIVQGDTLH